MIAAMGGVQSLFFSFSSARVGCVLPFKGSVIDCTVEKQAGLVVRIIQCLAGEVILKHEYGWCIMVRMFCAVAGPLGGDIWDWHSSDSKLPTGRRRETWLVASL